MDHSHKSDAVIQPDLVRRTSGGWLAIAPNGAKFPIGVTAPTAEEASERFRSSYVSWVQLLEAETT
jgi:hypothetical protein